MTSPKFFTLPMQPISSKYFALTISLGFALFSMFFGSGNLVFPILAGKMSHGHLLATASGLFLTSIIVPFLGAWAMWYRRRAPEKLYLGLGPGADIWFPLLALGLMGPFGILGRCITVAHGSIAYLIPQLPLPLFALALSVIIFAINYHKSWVIPILGKILTPLLILALAVIGVFGFLKSPPIHVGTVSSFTIFKSSLLQGYQTMDLLAAFFFSVVALEHINSQNDLREKAKEKIFLFACLIGAVLLALVYGMLIYLGGSFHEILSDVAPQRLLPKVAFTTLPSELAYVLCIAVVLACLTTAVALTDLFTSFLRTKLLPCSYTTGTLLTLGVAFAITLLDFDGIARFIAPILEMIYPALMTLSLLEIGRGYFDKPSLGNWPLKNCAVWIVLVISLVLSIS